MNWKNEAMDKLRQYTASRSAQRALAIQIKDIEEDLCAPPTARLESRYTECADYEDRRLNKLVFLELLRQRKRQTDAWLEAVELALGTLEPAEKQVLLYLYIAPRKGAVEELCLELGMERSSVYRTRERALETFTLALFGIDQ